jgi:hypothetical protein
MKHFILKDENIFHFYIYRRMSQSQESQDDDQQMVQSVQQVKSGFKSECKTKYSEIDFGPDTVEGLCKLKKGWINAPAPKKSAYKNEAKTITVGKKSISPYEHCRKLIYDTNESSTKPKLQKLRRIMPYFGYIKVKGKGGKWIKDGVEVSLTNNEVRDIIHKGILSEYKDYVYINDRCFRKNQTFMSYTDVYDDIYDKMKTMDRSSPRLSQSQSPSPRLSPWPSPSPSPSPSQSPRLSQSPSQSQRLSSGRQSQQWQQQQVLQQQSLQYRQKQLQKSKANIIKLVNKFISDLKRYNSILQQQEQPISQQQKARMSVINLIYELIEQLNKKKKHRISIDEYMKEHRLSSDLNDLTHNEINDLYEFLRKLN